MNSEKEELKNNIIRTIDKIRSQSPPGTTEESVLSNCCTRIFTRLGLTIPQFQLNMMNGQVSPENLRLIF